MPARQSSAPPGCLNRAIFRHREDAPAKAVRSRTLEDVAVAKKLLQLKRHGRI
jgi:hypothetical protein